MTEVTDNAARLLNMFFLPKAEPFRNEYLVIGTQRDMVRRVGLSIAYVNYAVKELEKAGIVTRLSAGVYILHRPIVWQGGSDE